MHTRRNFIYAGVAIILPACSLNNNDCTSKIESSISKIFEYIKNNVQSPGGTEIKITDQEKYSTLRLLTQLTSENKSVDISDMLAKLIDKDAASRNYEFYEKMIFTKTENFIYFVKNNDLDIAQEASKIDYNCKN